MGIFDFFKKKMSNNSTVQVFQHNNTKQKYIELIMQIDENMYVNDNLAQRLIEKAYTLTNDNITNRHFLYNKIIEYFYGLRDKQENALDLCIKYCKESINHTPKFLKVYKNEFHRNANEFVPPRIPAFQRLAIIYENNNEYAKAIEICEKALELNLKDGTKGGFEGRIIRLSKKLDKYSK